jgi:protein tyrosine phosphatase (PTP) superfamily phosphohydrolase (DUF442 family)
MLTDIHSYLPISAQLATAGQPTAAQFTEIAAAGFTTVINLALPTSTNALPDERTVVEAQGMTYYPIPVEWEHPTLRDFQQFASVLAQSANPKVFVHCAMNMRVSAFVYVYRRLRDVPQDAAAADLAKIWQPNETWQNFIDAGLTV